MATFTKVMSGDSRYSITLTVTETATHPSQNTSDVSWTLTSTKTSGTGYEDTESNNPVRVIINDQIVFNQKIGVDWRGASPKTITLATGTVNGILHNTDGSKSINVSGYLSTPYIGLGSATASGTMQLTQLHKAPVINSISITETNPALTGVPNDTFVDNLSVKNITINATADSGSTIDFYQVSNGDVYSTGSSSNVQTLTFGKLTLENNKVNINTRVIDNDNVETIKTFQYNNYILYTLPNIVPTSSEIKRNGPLTGKVKMTLQGSFFNSNVGSVSNTIALQFKYWKKGTAEPDDTEYKDIPFTPTTGSNNISIINWNVSVSGSEITDVDPQNDYYFKIKATDHFSTNIITLLCPKGEYVWAEYKDHVDFKKITIDGVDEIFYQSGDTITLLDTYIASGFISNSSLDVYALVHLPKSLKNITSVTCTSCRVEARGSKGYLNSSSGSKEYVGASGYTVNTYIASENSLRVRIRKSSAWTNVDNNTLIELNGGFTFTLS